MGYLATVSFNYHTFKMGTDGQFDHQPDLTKRCMEGSVLLQKMVIHGTVMVKQACSKYGSISQQAGTPEVGSWGKAA